jgi:hypothetical protein
MTDWGSLIDSAGSPVNTYGPVEPPSDEEAAAFIVQKAKELGKDPQEALRVWANEGKGAWQSNYKYKGKREPSFGPMQLFTGGGLGNEFQQQTGLDPSDPRTWKEGTDFALEKAAEGGWQPWNGARRAGAGPTWEDAPGQQASMEPMRATEPQPYDAAEDSPNWGSMIDSAGEQQAPQAPEPAADFFTPGAGKYEPKAPVTAGGMFDQGMNQMLREGVPAAIGFPKAAAQGIEAADTWFRDKVGLQPGLHFADDLPLPTTEQAKSVIQPLVPKREAQNVPEEYAGTVGEFLPTMAYGAGGVGRRVLQTVIPAIASETGGQIGRQISPEAETALRVAGSFASPTKPRAPKALADDTRALSQANYKAAENIGLKIKGVSFYKFAQSLSKDKVVNSLKLDPERTPYLSKLASTIDSAIAGPPKPLPQPAMKGMTGVGAPQQKWRPGTMTLEEFDNIRQAAKDATMSPDANERRIAGHIVKRLDAYFGNLKNKDVASGDPSKVMGHLTEARKLWRVAEKEESLAKITEVAKDRAGQFSVSGHENAIRTGFRQLSVKIAKDPREARRWTPDEIKLIRQLSRGWHTRDQLARIGAVLNNPMVRGIGGGAAGYASYSTQDPNAVILASIAYLVGKGARGGAGRLAGNKVNHLNKVVRGGGKELPGGRGIIPVQPYVAYEDQ